MRRSTLVGAGIAAVLVAATAAAVPGMAAAETAKPFNMIDVTIGAPQGEQPGDRTEPITVWAMCSPVTAGNHPYLADVCRELATARGSVAAVKPLPDRRCDEDYNPVTVTVTGHWNGKAINFTEEQSNECFATASHGHVFELLQSMLKVTISAPVGSGETGTTAWLVCSPVRLGDHPYPYAACADIIAANGDISKIAPLDGGKCSEYYEPVDISVTGHWKGEPVGFRETASNRECAQVSHGYVFAGM